MSSIFQRNPFDNTEIGYLFDVTASSHPQLPTNLCRHVGYFCVFSEVSMNMLI